MLGGEVAIFNFLETQETQFHKYTYIPTAHPEQTCESSSNFRFLIKVRKHRKLEHALRTHNHPAMFWTLSNQECFDFLLLLQHHNINSNSARWRDG